MDLTHRGHRPASGVALRSWCGSLGRASGRPFLPRRCPPTDVVRDPINPDAQPSPTRRAVTTALALTWLNPAMYVDTLVMLGSLSTHFPGEQLSLGLGSMAGTLLWFPVLGFGAAALSKPLSRPRVWTWINCAIGCVILAVALNLALNAL
ncbi:hypothetical protein GC425_01975 [Corynebacterium sp. zg254]|uniref:LysE type translocator n=1 Tax=Corynebacterium zhongnanshanii TaxID=2768834 RepID=A0ABQ6VFQ6_9CORY|nr:hypothetical protein F8377_03650 [Corynebacterium zhongnanshanii]MCR5913638.1 hypothetical protein [Corynebacterium sp. zg254]